MESGIKPFPGLITYWWWACKESWNCVHGWSVYCCVDYCLLKILCFIIIIYLEILSKDVRKKFKKEDICCRDCMQLSGNDCIETLTSCMHRLHWNRIFIQNAIVSDRLEIYGRTSSQNSVRVWINGICGICFPQMISVTFQVAVMHESRVPVCRCLLIDVMHWM